MAVLGGHAGGRGTVVPGCAQVGPCLAGDCSAYPNKARKTSSGRWPPTCFESSRCRGDSQISEKRPARGYSGAPAVAALTPVAKLLTHPLQSEVFLPFSMEIVPLSARLQQLALSVSLHRKEPSLPFPRLLQQPQRRRVALAGCENCRRGATVAFGTQLHIGLPKTGSQARPRKSPHRGRVPHHGAASRCSLPDPPRGLAEGLQSCQAAEVCGEVRRRLADLVLGLQVGPGLQREREVRKKQRAKKAEGQRRLQEAAPRLLSFAKCVGKISLASCARRT